MVKGRTVIATPFLSGNTIRVKFRIVDEDGVGFQPDTLTISIYDVQVVDGWSFLYTLSPLLGPTVESVIVNDQDGIDASGYVDSDGQVLLYLTPDDTTIDVPSAIVSLHHERRILFTWTWDSPAKTAKHEIFFKIAPDRETVAA